MAAGDRAAWRELLRRHHLSAFAIAYGILCNPGDADAVVARAFEQVWRSAPEFDVQRGIVSRWLFAITRVKAVERLRELAPR
jgi:RNA polymerase sigma-70 factor (ECF subfamily)